MNEQDRITERFKLAGLWTMQKDVKADYS